MQNKYWLSFCSSSLKHYAFLLKKTYKNNKLTISYNVDNFLLSKARINFPEGK